MIAEYERAQIAERSRRGKRHRAQQGTVSALSGAPYGYRYVKKTDTSAAYYEVIQTEAEVVRLVYDAYAQQGLSINAITRLLNERQVPTRTGTSRWERTTVGPCCAIPRTVVRLASGKRSVVLAKRSPACYDNAVAGGGKMVGRFSTSRSCAGLVEFRNAGRPRHRHRSGRGWRAQRPVA